MTLTILRYSSTTSAITFQQFVNVMSGKRTQSFTCAVHWRDRQVSSAVSSENNGHDPTFLCRCGMIATGTL